MAQNWVVTRRKQFVLAALDTLLWPLSAAVHSEDGRDELGEPRKILVLEFWQIGDAIMAEPFLRRLRHRFPGAEIVLLCKEHVRMLLAPSGVVDRFIIADIPWTAFDHKYAPRRFREAGMLGLLRSLRRERFDLTIDARMDFRSNFLTYLIRARRRVGFAAPGGYGLLTDAVPVTHESSHKVEDWLAMLAPLGDAAGAGTLQPITVHNSAPSLDIDPDVQARADAKLAQLGFTGAGLLIAVHPSASQPVRRWPLERFASVIAELVQRPDTTVAVFVGPDGYGSSLQDAGATCIGATLEELPAYLARCDLFVGNDSGPAHIAAAVGTPTVTIFGPQNADWYRPYGPHGTVVHITPMPCRPCFDRCTQPSNICLTGIPASAVLAEVLGALEKRGDGLRHVHRHDVDLVPLGGEIPA